LHGIADDVVPAMQHTPPSGSFILARSHDGEMIACLTVFIRQGS
jgi:hypothetical protein